MRYLSIDLEATGLKEDDLIIELGFVPFDTKTREIAKELSFHSYVQCPSFEQLKPSLDPWVIEHNQTLITKANAQGVSLNNLPTVIKNYLEGSALKNYFNNEKIVIFGKSLNAIDLPFLNRDLGWNFIRNYFSHKVVDLSCVAFGLIDLGILPEGAHSSSALMNYFKMGNVAHTALDDAINCASIYLQLISKFAIQSA